jgi:ABC-type transport system involved in cytochrome bd biosynthesis fused ATPase/permease subunit
MLKIRIRRDPYEKDDYLYTKSELVINSGITCLVGRNGSGKSTLINAIVEFADKENIACYRWDNYKDGGSMAMERYGFYDDFEALATCFSASEGQRISFNLGKQLKNIAKLIRENDRSIILFDAVDSGLDISNINDLRFVLDSFINKDFKDKEVYIIMACNTFTLAKNYDCIWVVNFEHLNFIAYEEYEKFIIGEKDDKR